MPNEDENDPSFTVPNFRREEMEGQREAQDRPGERRTDGRYLRGLAFRISELLIRENKAEFDLGGLIDEVCVNHLWNQWPGQTFTRFEDWSWTVLGFRARKAEYLRKNWLALSAMHLSDIALTTALRIGWSKLKEILRVARDEVTLFQWIERCNENNWNEKQLKAAIIEAGAPTRPTAAGDPDSAPNDASPDEGRRRFEVVFEDGPSFRTVRQAIEVVARRYDPEMGDGKALAMMATSYLSSVPRDDEGGAAVELEYLIRQIEANYGVRLVVAPDAGEDATDDTAAAREFPVATPAPPPPARGASDAALDI